MSGLRDADRTLNNRKTSRRRTMASSPMEKVGQVRKFKLYRAGTGFAYPGYHLWTGKRHVQVWPLRRFGKSGDEQ